MKSNTKTFAAAAGIAFVAATAAALGAGVAARSAAPTVVAVIDIDRLSVEMDEFKIPTEAFESLQTTRRDELTALQAQIASIDEELRLIPETDQDTRIAKLIQRTTADSELKARVQLYQQASDIEQAQLFKKMYDTIEAGSAKLAARDSIDIVLIDDRVFVIHDMNRAAQTAALDSKKILFANDTVDLTDELLTMLNNDFNTGQ